MFSILFPSRASLVKESFRYSLEPIVRTKKDLEVLGLSALDFVVAASSYHKNTEIRQAIFDCKYEQNPSIIQQLAQIVLPVFSTYVPKEFALCAVPMHWWPRWQRGFNQSELLAEILVAHTEHVYTSLLRRRFSFGHQANRTRQERLDALCGKFYSTTCVPEKVCIIDDVFTTGATTNECAKILKNYGAKQVYVCTVALSEYCKV